ncbi:hypothetical protein DFH05DRAFT_1517950 [Lentinula detonsa]|uniref:Uncharacterized protein n=1 Tax=Lentinula detonsa TaxID=2804962 RepID=A0A9W8P9U6_9AGAR|nr:hypothetical protein DFH05DRAFT_1517950 [Lentinula detonsa]
MTHIADSNKQRPSESYQSKWPIPKTSVLITQPECSNHVFESLGDIESLPPQKEPSPSPVTQEPIEAYALDPAPH